MQKTEENNINLSLEEYVEKIRQKITEWFLMDTLYNNGGKMPIEELKDATEARVSKFMEYVFKEGE